ncbi:MAG: hypothetical protein HFE85_03205 [Clostridiales bacterium]|nr:hypothetical protein [Clostridiales bacterium]
MRTLYQLEEFKKEAGEALFTKQQAISVTLRLLEMELKNPQNSEDDRRILADAMKQASFHYIDQTQTGIDSLLDSVGVARIPAVSIADAVSQIIFDVE